MVLVAEIEKLGEVKRHVLLLKQVVRLDNDMNGPHVALTPLVDMDHIVHHSFIHPRVRKMFIKIKSNIHLVIWLLYWPHCK